MNFLSINLSNIPPFSAKIRLYNSGLVGFELISTLDIIAIYNITGIPKTAKLDSIFLVSTNSFPVIIL